MKVAITGAGGFLGACATRFFANNPAITRVNALYSQPTEVPKDCPSLNVCVGDLRNEAVCTRLVEDVDTVIHFAHRGYPRDGHENSVKTVSENLKITGSLLDAMKKKGVKRILYPSSADGLYKFDPFKKVPHHELSEIEYRTGYSLSKIETEHLLHYYEQSHGIRSVIFRLSSVYCAEELNRANLSFIGHVFSQLRKRETVTIAGALDVYKDYLYVEDMLRAFYLTLKKKELTGTYNLGSGIGTSPREILTNAERITGTKIKTQTVDKNPFDSTWTILNTQKLQRILNWGCHFSLFDGMKATWGQQSSTQPTKIAA